jgi:hypothetical protein
MYIYIKWWREAFAVLAQHCKHNTFKKKKSPKRNLQIEVTHVHLDVFMRELCANLIAPDFSFAVGGGVSFVHGVPSIRHIFRTAVLLLHYCLRGRIFHLGGGREGVLRRLRCVQRVR